MECLFWPRLLKATSIFGARIVGARVAGFSTWRVHFLSPTMQQQLRPAVLAPMGSSPPKRTREIDTAGLELLWKAPARPMCYQNFFVSSHLPGFFLGGRLSRVGLLHRVGFVLWTNAVFYGGCHAGGRASPPFFPFVPGQSTGFSTFASSDYLLLFCLLLVHFLVNCYFFTYLFSHLSLLIGERGTVKTKRGGNSFWCVHP